MPIDRKNSFHLMLSDDEMTLLRLLAEREGLTASDYLRTVLRRLAGMPAQILQVMKVSDLVGAIDFTKRAPATIEAPARAKRKKAAK